MLGYKFTSLWQNNTHPKYRDHESKLGVRAVVSKKVSSDIYGNKLLFCIFSHGLANHCMEYVLIKEVFNFRRWTLYMTILSSLAFYLEFYNANVNFLGLIVFFLLVILLLKLHLKVKEESLLVMASLGLQLTTTFVSGRKASRFILSQSVDDVVINEAITMQRVVHYLVVLIKSTDGISTLIPLFQKTLPRLDCLEKIYRGIQDVIYGSDLQDTGIIQKILKLN